MSKTYTIRRDGARHQREGERTQPGYELNQGINSTRHQLNQGTNSTKERTQPGNELNQGMNSTRV